MPAKKKAAKKAAAKRKPRSRGRAPSPPTAPPEPAPKASGRVMTVRSRRQRFRRAGLTFSTAPTTVREDEIGEERFERILNEPQLRCELIEK